MNILVMIDSFKGSISSYEAGETIKKTILDINKNDKVIVLPIADGGEGTVNALMNLSGVKEVKVNVKNPLLEEHMASYAIDEKNNLAIMEMSQASGLTLIENRLSPIKASTFGVGQMILDALDKNVNHFIIGIGGSATNDGGIGMLMALGYKFLDKNKKEISQGIGGVELLDSIDFSKVDKRLKECSFDIACDVDNPLTGVNGASYVYGPQKGANKKEVIIIDDLLSKYHKITKKYIVDADNKYKGVGAAGGLGYAFKNYLNANLESGINLILDLINAEEYIKNSDLIITGEGKIDYQTSMGKTPVGIARLAKKYNKKVIAFSGVVDNDAIAVNKKGIDAFFPIIDKISPLEEVMSKDKTKENLTRCVSQVINLINLWR